MSFKNLRRLMSLEEFAENFLALVGLLILATALHQLPEVPKDPTGNSHSVAAASARIN